MEDGDEADSAAETPGTFSARHRGHGFDLILLPSMADPGMRSQLSQAAPRDSNGSTSMLALAPNGHAADRRVRG